MYTVFLVVGTILMIMSYSSTFYNERKYLNLNRVKSKIEEQLYRADLNKNSTSKEHENRLVFARGPISFEQPAKDEDLEFATTDGMVLFRNVEIYQWVM